LAPKIQINHDEIAVRQIHPSQADLDVSYNPDLDGVGNVIADTALPLVWSEISERTRVN